MPLTDFLWPILLSAVFVFVVSSVLHMLLPIHKGDYRQMPGEAAVLAAMRAAAVQPGDYMFPFASSMKDLGSPEMIAKRNEGPVGVMSITPNGPLLMGKALGQWFGYSLLISLFTAYLVGQAYGADAAGRDVFQFTSGVAFLGYGLWSFNDSIWKSVAWCTTLKFMFDGLLYALATGAAFVWMWPAAG